MFTLGDVLAHKIERNGGKVPYQTYWIGGNPKACDTCQGPFEAVMYDANTGRGWGNLCQKCFDYYGCTLGTGRGQKYEIQLDGRWLKTAG